MISRCMPDSSAPLYVLLLLLLCADAAPALTNVCHFLCEAPLHVCTVQTPTLPPTANDGTGFVEVMHSPREGRRLTEMVVSALIDPTIKSGAALLPFCGAHCAFSSPCSMTQKSSRARMPARDPLPG